MKTPRSATSHLGLATKRLAFGLGLGTSPRHRTTPPPILLRSENQVSRITVSEGPTTKPRGEKNLSSSLRLPTPIMAKGSPLKAMQSASGLITRAMNWLQTRQLGRSHKRRLHVAETVSLGEKRFVAVIQIDGSQYLVGGGATNVALLAHLSGTESFQEMLKQTMTIAESQIENPVIEQLREKA